ncbi:MAG TPA: uroporphyrinogen-III synthase [Xanthobacteraceae bacterium]|nr:uroporphyrinogen-III synthase [Xanthobacteraceae bacterium]
MLVTRPAFDAERTAATLRELGCDVLTDPAIAVEAVDASIPALDYDAIVFTSANGVRAAKALDHFKELPVFAVGVRTAEVAREYGFQKVGVAAGEVNALGNLIAAALPAGARVLHLAGEDRAGDLPGRLLQVGIKTEVAVLYRAKPAAALKTETIQAFRDGQLDAVLHYSERSATAFLRLARGAGIDEDIRKTRHICLSAAVAAPLQTSGLPAEIAAAPDEQALFTVLGAQALDNPLRGEETE